MSAEVEMSSLNNSHFANQINDTHLNETSDLNLIQPSLNGYPVATKTDVLSNNSEMTNLKLDSPTASPKPNPLKRKHSNCDIPEPASKHYKPVDSEKITEETKSNKVDDLQHSDSHSSTLNNRPESAPESTATTSASSTPAPHIDTSVPQIMKVGPPKTPLIPLQRIPVRDFNWKPRSIDCYRSDRLTLIGEGTYGSVFLAKDQKGKTVALKKVRLQKNEGFPITAIREIKLLKSLRHDNLIPLLDVCSTHEYTQSFIETKDDEGNLVKVPTSTFKEGDVFMVFPYMDHDLSGILESGVTISDAQVKYYMQKILEGLDYLHRETKVLHRDVKPANIFVGNDGAVRIGDFGLGRKQNKLGEYTNRVVTLWYRAPELLLGLSGYTSAIDMWSTGCVFAELLTRGQVLFPGQNSDLDQLNKIYDVCGTPSEANWPGVSSLPCFQKFIPKYRSRVVRHQFRNYSSQAVDLLDRLLTLDPLQRITAEEALKHPYFTTEAPKPMLQSAHPLYLNHLHEYNSKRKRRHREMAQLQEEETRKRQKP